VLCPLPLPGVATLANKALVKSWPFRLGAMANFMIARPDPATLEPRETPSVTVVVPARNESGNINAVFTRLPDIGRATELIFVEGHSRDDTYPAIDRVIARHPERSCRLSASRARVRPMLSVAAFNTPPVTS
jgi:hypothetical protein